MEIICRLLSTHSWFYSFSFHFISITAFPSLLFHLSSPPQVLSVYFNRTLSFLLSSFLSLSLFILVFLNLFLFILFFFNHTSPLSSSSSTFLLHSSCSPYSSSFKVHFPAPFLLQGSLLFTTSPPRPFLFTPSPPKPTSLHPFSSKAHFSPFLLLQAPLPSTSSPDSTLPHPTPFTSPFPSPTPLHSSSSSSTSSPSSSSCSYSSSSFSSSSFCSSSRLHRQKSTPSYHSCLLSNNCD